MTNTLYYGDNLEILRQHVSDESVDLVYLDPPFNSNANYNVLFKEQSGEESPAQIKAFTDTWEWTQEAERTFEQEIILNPETPPNVKDMISAFRQFIGSNAMMAYLVMMAPRLVELRRVLRPTGSIYLHCDTTAESYLKTLMDAVLGPRNFRNAIVWKRFNFHADARRFGRVSDRLLFYSKTDAYAFNQQRVPFSKKYIDSKFTHEDADGHRFRLDNLNPPGGRGPVYEFHGVTKAWRFTEGKMSALENDGRIYTGSRVPQLKRYLDELNGQAVHDIWDDISPINSQAKERLGYPTQKPQALLERIIQTSSNEGDVVLDPFCGCGTAIAAAEKLKRRWFGIDVTHLAVALMKSRLKTAFNIVPGTDYQVIGEPADVGSARALAEQDRYQFQYWAMSLLEAFPREQGKKGADKGIDGVVYFLDGPQRSPNKAVVQVKSGKVSSPHVRDLKGTVEREKAALGLFITLDEPTAAMRTEAISAGYYHSDVWQKDYPKIQIRTIADLLQDKTFDIPPHPSMYQSAQRVRRAEGRQSSLEEVG